MNRFIIASIFITLIFAQVHAKTDDEEQSKEGANEGFGEETKKEEGYGSSGSIGGGYENKGGYEGGQSGYGGNKGGYGEQGGYGGGKGEYGGYGSGSYNKGNYGGGNEFGGGYGGGKGYGGTGHGGFKLGICPDKFGLFPNPSDCCSFIQCSHGKGYIQKCGPGTLWDPYKKTCNYPYKTHCQAGNPECAKYIKKW